MAHRVLSAPVMTKLASSLKVALVGAWLASVCGGCAPDCDPPTSCEEICSGIGDPADPNRDALICVANAGATGGDLVLEDEAGNEVFRCYEELDALGQEVGSCSADYAEAKLEYCGCG